MVEKILYANFVQSHNYTYVHTYVSIRTYVHSQLTSQVLTLECNCACMYVQGVHNYYVHVHTYSVAKLFMIKDSKVL